MKGKLKIKTIIRMQQENKAFCQNQQYSQQHKRTVDKFKSVFNKLSLAYTQFILISTNAILCNLGKVWLDYTTHCSTNRKDMDSAEKSKPWILQYSHRMIRRIW
jgi:hypothetical protein